MWGMDEYDQIEAEYMARHPAQARAMDEYDLIEAEYMARHPAQAPPSFQMQLFPLGNMAQHPLAQVPPPTEPLLRRRVAGLPVWGWGLGVVGAASFAYYLFTQKKVTANDGDSSSGSADLPALPAGWEPSRTGFCTRLQPFLQKNGIADKTTVYSDADDAAKKLKQVSPLVTIQCKATKVPIKELDKFAKREGLTAVEHDAGVVGFYPSGGKKGKSWEEYIDALREEGQKV
jgi:hypothetical protein